MSKFGAKKADMPPIPAINREKLMSMFIQTQYDDNRPYMYRIGIVKFLLNTETGDISMIWLGRDRVIDVNCPLVDICFESHKDHKAIFNETYFPDGILDKIKN